VDTPDPLVTHARQHGIVLMAGAGLSMGAPTCLPGWNGLNDQIVEALGQRIESYLEKPGATAQLRDSLQFARKSGSLPPDYQAQILEELCGATYFSALQSLDVAVKNDSHRAIAALAKCGYLRAIVTTNFDRLIETALDDAQVPHRVLFDEDGYREGRRLLDDHKGRDLVVLKVHGCVSTPGSLVDTLKQRLRGRNKDLNDCLAVLLSQSYWLIAGFSAADLETDADYLQFLPSAAAAVGFTYLQYPGSDLSPGANRLLAAYTGKSRLVEVELPSFFRMLCKELSSPLPEPEPAPLSPVDRQISVRLSEWAGVLTPAASVTCLSALFEASGQAEGAFELLHRFWKDVLAADRSGHDFEEYRFQHGRLGIGGGLLNSADLERDVGSESLQNLFRRQDDPRARAWAGLALFWLGRGDDARAALNSAANACDDTTKPELRVDVGIALAEAMYLAGEPEWFLLNWERLANLAEQAGDLPRQALVIALAALYHSEFKQKEFSSFWPEAARLAVIRSRRLQDSRIEGFLCLAQGRYLIRQHDTQPALGFLNEAISNLRQAGRTPWRILASIEYSKGLMDLARLEEAGAQLDKVGTVVEGWPICLVWFEEARGQLYTILGQHTEARVSFERALGLATEMKLQRRAQALRRYLQ
jgi:tetratricopeptide (TPR) repeat protein